jgi:two-component system response regulator MprA
MPAYHILIADDDDGVRVFLARSAARIYPAATVVAVADGAAALIAFSQQPADLVITDTDMPRLNGLDLTRLLRSQQVMIPILALSSDSAVAADALAAGATRFLAKPVSVRVLRQTLLDLLLP